METSTSTAQTAGSAQLYGRVFRTPSAENLFYMALEDLGLEITSGKQLRFKQNVLLLMKHHELPAKELLVSAQSLKNLVSRTKDLVLSRMIGSALEAVRDE